MTSKKASKRRQKGMGGDLPAQKYEPTPQEQAALDALASRRAERSLAPCMKLNDNDSGQITFDHDEIMVGFDLLMNAVGTTDTEFLCGLLSQIANAAKHEEKPNVLGTNFMLSVVKGIEPQDEIEAMLATQMAAVHMATTSMAGGLARAETMQKMEAYDRALNRLARTFTAQVEALKRYRTGGEQKVTVQHVTVNEGGQAVVGNVSNSAGGRGAKKK